MDVRFVRSQNWIRIRRSAAAAAAVDVIDVGGHCGGDCGEEQITTLLLSCVMFVCWSESEYCRTLWIKKMSFWLDE